jgi:hypothetical protein
MMRSWNGRKKWYPMRIPIIYKESRGRSGDFIIRY